MTGDTTAVSYFGLPLYGYISTPDTVRTNTGLYQPLSEIFSHVLRYFNPKNPNKAPAYVNERAEWNKLILYAENGVDVLRVISPQKSISAAPIPPVMNMDPNYFDNESEYGYSYYQNILEFYRSNTLTISLAGATQSGDTYTGVVNSDGSITMTGMSTGFIVTIAAPTSSDTSPTLTTTYSIFSGTPALASTTNTNPEAIADAVQIGQFFADAIIPGLIPTTETISLDFLAGNKKRAYEYNKNLTTTKETGPWYCLYSKSLHSLGYLYTYAFDEPIWPEVQITSQYSEISPIPTYMAIRVGPVTESTTRSKTKISIESSENPAEMGTPVRFTISVTSDQLTGHVKGYVLYTIDDVLQEPILLVKGKAVTQPYVLTPGRHLIKGIYTGDVNHFPSKFRRLTQYITSSTLTATTTTLVSSKNPSGVDEEVTFTAIVKNSKRVNKIGPPTGSVIFKIDGVSHTVPLIDHRASFSTSSLSQGKHRIRAIYSGDTDHLDSKSTVLTQVVKSVVPPSVAPPRDLHVHQIKQCCLIQTEFVNVITWKAPRILEPPVLYRIYRNANLTNFVAEVKAAPNQNRFQYKDNNRKEGQTYKYFIVSVDAAGDISQPAEVIYSYSEISESSS